MTKNVRTLTPAIGSPTVQRRILKKPQPDLELIPARLNDAEKFQRIAARHLSAFAWVDQGWIPLGIFVNSPRHREGITYDDWLNPDVFLRLQAGMLRDTLEVGSDMLPIVTVNHMGAAIVSSVFGLELRVCQQDVTSIENAGPWITPRLRTISDVNSLPAPEIHSDLLSCVEEFLRYYRRCLPEWVHVTPPAMMGPFSLAELIRGAEFYLDLITSPKECRKLIDLCARTIILVDRHFRNLLGQGRDRHLSQFGIAGPGPRIGEDSIINISPTMIAEFAATYHARIADAYGGSAYLHVCTLPHRRADHVFEAMIDIPSVVAVSSQFGYAYYERHVDRLEGRLAVESLYGNALAHIIQQYGSFEQWALDFVPRFKHRSGLVLYCEVESVDHGKRLWEAWQRAHESSR